MTGVHEIVAIGGLGAEEAAVRVNGAQLHVVFELMGWIPEGRQQVRPSTATVVN